MLWSVLYSALHIWYHVCLHRTFLWKSSPFRCRHLDLAVWILRWRAFAFWRGRWFSGAVPEFWDIERLWNIDATSPTLDFLRFSSWIRFGSHALLIGSWIPWLAIILLLDQLWGPCFSRRQKWWWTSWCCLSWTLGPLSMRFQSCFGLNWTYLPTFCCLLGQEGVRFHLRYHWRLLVILQPHSPAWSGLSVWKAEFELQRLHLVEPGPGYRLQSKSFSCCFSRWQRSSRKHWVLCCWALAGCLVPSPLILPADWAVPISSASSPRAFPYPSASSSSWPAPAAPRESSSSSAGSISTYPWAWGPCVLRCLYNGLHVLLGLRFVRIDAFPSSFCRRAL